MKDRAQNLLGVRVVLHRYRGPFGRFSYPRYKRIQQEANIRKLGSQWARSENIAYLGAYLKLSLSPDLQFGLCHGTRQGKEQEWFSEVLGCKVLGTEISETATQFANTIEWDFHDVKPEWKQATDFIYSNSLDHSYNPVLAIKQWVSCLRPGGILLLEHSDRHHPEAATKVDPFGISLDDLVLFINRLGKGEFRVHEILDGYPVTRKAPGYLACVVVKKAEK